MEPAQVRHQTLQIQNNGNSRQFKQQLCVREREREREREKNSTSLGGAGSALRVNGRLETRVVFPYYMTRTPQAR
ncbi:hypothetical protein chiPu_0023554, partial [Chiloscyllium punctatum]|nr:hypothetical protein [Chiloscyllium punctatum]